MRPDADQLRAMDDELALKGVPILDRPKEAALLWAQRNGRGFVDSIADWRWFDQAFAQLHPSVNFDDKPFALLCVSARGVPYKFNPPIVFGQVRLNPLEFVSVGQDELERIYCADPDAYWDLTYQAADAFDLFTCNLSHIDCGPEASKMIGVGYSELEASARQLISGTSSSHSLAHAACVAVETIAKGVLSAAGSAEIDLRKLKHNLQGICTALAELVPSTNDYEFLTVASTMPDLVASRYTPKTLNGAEMLDLYRRALFLCAEAMRRTDKGLASLLYRQIAEDQMVPKRRW